MRYATTELLDQQAALWGPSPADLEGWQLASRRNLA